MYRLPVVDLCSKGFEPSTLFVHTEGVTGSIPVAPTIRPAYLLQIPATADRRALQQPYRPVLVAE